MNQLLIALNHSQAGLTLPNVRFKISRKIQRRSKTTNSLIEAEKLAKI